MTVPMNPESPALHELAKITKRADIMRKCLGQIATVAKELNGNEHAGLGQLGVDSATDDGFDLVYAGRRFRFGFVVAFTGTTLPESRLRIVRVTDKLENEVLLDEPVIEDEGIVDSWKMPDAGWGATLTDKGDVYVFLLNFLLHAFGFKHGPGKARVVG